MIEDRGEGGIYKPFMQNHIVGPMDNEKLTRRLSIDVINAFDEAEALEEKFREDAERLKAEEAAKKNKFLTDQWRQ